MKPAFSVIFLTTLIGAGQGLFIALILQQPFEDFSYGGFAMTAALTSLALLILGLLASFFHLGRPERAWRAASCWRTSWLSREVITLPLAMFTIALYTWLYARGVSSNTNTAEIVGFIGIPVMLLLFLCTAMIYVSIKFLQEWSTPWTLINFTLLGLSSGFLLASALAYHTDYKNAQTLWQFSIALLLISLLAKAATLYRNSRIKAKSSIQTAIGIKHRHITQRSMGLTGGSFNTRAFFHHCTDQLIRHIKIFMLTTVFFLPLALLLLSRVMDSATLLWIACAIHYIGLIAERWLFFAQANHPQNLYYQTVG